MPEHTEFFSVTTLLARYAVDHPDDIALRQKEFGIWQETTWLEYHTQAHAIAAGLVSLGLERNSHAGILSENRLQWLLSQMGCNCAGVVPCGLYPTSPANEVLHLLGSADCSLVFCEDQEQVDKVLEITDQLPLLKHIVVFDPKGLNNYQAPELITLSELATMGYEYLRREPGAVAGRLEQQQAEDTALIVFTSGSTGLPKAAMISYRNIWAQMLLLEDAIPCRAGEDLLSYLPLCHVAEQSFSMMRAMATRMVVNFGESLRTIRTDLQEIAPRMFFGVPRIWEKMQAEIVVLTSRSGPMRRALLRMALDSAQRRGQRPRSYWTTGEKLKYLMWYWITYRHLLNYLGLRRCKVAMTAAAPISPDLLAQLRGLGLPLIEVWGMTETSGAATMQPMDLDCQGRIGSTVEGVQSKIAADGELMIKGPTVFKGYYNNPSATADTVIDGWLHTGDVVEGYHDGSLTIIDRKKDIIISAGGKNLSPSVIENTVKASPLIKECIVIGDKRPYVVALIQIDYDTVATWAEEGNLAYTTFKSLAEMPQVRVLIEHEIEQANRKLASVEQVKKFALLNKELDHDDGEVTATMKVRRSKISEQYGAQIELLYDSAGQRQVA